VPVSLSEPISLYAENAVVELATQSALAPRRRPSLHMTRFSASTFGAPGKAGAAARRPAALVRVRVCAPAAARRAFVRSFSTPRQARRGAAGSSRAVKTRTERRL
jgi:hypothetical protein